MIDPAKNMSKKELIAELEEHNDFFDMIVDMFPSSVYVTGSNQADQQGQQKKKQQQQKENVNIKFHKKAAPPASFKLDRKKRDEAAKQEKQHKEQTQKEETRATNGQTQAQKSKSNGEDTTKSLPSSPPSAKSDNKSRIESLRAKLQAKIAEKQANRPNNGSTPDQVSKRAARRAEKRKRQEEAKKRASHKKAKSTAATTALPKYQVSNSPAATPAQDLEQVDFGRLTGLNPKDKKDAANRTKDILQNLTKPKNIHKMLADAEAKQAKLNELKQKQQEEADNNGAKDQLAALQWKDTFKEADGTRVKDDPAKLKKALKRKVAKKAKSAKAWQSRTEQASSAAKERQKIRQHNLSARKQGGKVGANLSRKEIREDNTNKKEDEGRKLSRAGFEGRKREFLNKEKKTVAGSKKGHAKNAKQQQQ